ncbi:hypothetical protein PTRG_06858 [Pyrenophora tritici-repentis Pt-1C-BFP]|uniref:Uncharacterized protein n=1 Tax=Pyrenophora tritici-repentis (strain Pt-1C-BFP) TaxID=426418 RepID=B2WA50_PYRTR|nr:uncharacterized protein PTRG_06858 [Pyrenophora tritici-repentis Pt-1C-BFP]EDU49778.1 hypothetical protein PTRG_06858 [Pyrenophora tritici-repentis Pt-1C-BFP]
MSFFKSNVDALTSPIYDRSLWVGKAIFGIVIMVYGYRWIRYRSQIVASQPGDKATRQLMQILAHNSVIHLASFMFYCFIIPLNLATVSKPKVRHWDNLYITLVTKGTNRETVKRSAATMRHIQSLSSRITFIVLTDEGSSVASLELGVKIVVVPKSFSPPTAKYKARALEYFRINQQLTDTDWVLHLDEETAHMNGDKELSYTTL